MRKHGCWKEILKNSGNHFTDLRATVIEILEENKEYLCAKDIYMKAHQKNPSIGLTTVYRTLELLVQLGYVQKFEFGDGKARYEMIGSNDGERHHHHLVCVKCKTIIDYTDYVNEELEFLNKTENALSQKFNFKIHNHMIRFYGLCEKCQ